MPCLPALPIPAAIAIGIDMISAQGAAASGNLKGAAADFRRAVEILMDLPSTGDEV